MLQLKGECYEFKEANADNPGLTIGGFELAFSLDIVVAFLFTKL